MIVALLLATAPVAATDAGGIIGDLGRAVAACEESLRSGDNPPLADGWRVGTHSKGTPYGVAALKARDMNAIMGAMAYSREQFGLAGKELVLSQYYRRGELIACSISAKIAPTAAAQEALRSALGLSGPPDSPGSVAADLAKQYMLQGGGKSHPQNGFAISIEPSFDLKPDQLSVFVFKG